MTTPEAKGSKKSIVKKTAGSLPREFPPLKDVEITVAEPEEMKKAITSDAQRISIMILDLKYLIYGAITAAKEISPLEIKITIYYLNLEDGRYNIEGKYSIPTEVGTFKVSFDEVMKRILFLQLIPEESK